MIANVFYDKDLKITETSKLYKYEEGYLNYQIIDILKKKKNILSSKDIQIELEKYYGVNINYSRLKEYLGAFFSSIDDYSITPLQEDIYNQTQKFKNDLFLLKWDREEDLRTALNNYLGFYQFNVSDALPYILTISMKQNNLTEDNVVAKYFDLLIRKEEYYTKIDTCIDSIDESYYALPISIIIRDKLVAEFLFANGVNKAKDLASVSVETIMTLFASNIDSCIFAISNLNGENKQSFLTDIDDLFNSLGDKRKEVLALRGGFYDKVYTLEEVGERFEVTRERARQIEKKATEIVKEKSKNYINQIYAMYFSLCNDDERYVSADKIIEYAENDFRSKCLLFMIGVSDFEIKYDRNLNIVYDVSSITLEDLASEISEKYGDVISVDDYNTLNLFERTVIETSYRIVYSNFWIKKNFHQKELIGALIDEYFPDGYGIGNIEHYELLKTKFEEKYGDVSDFPSDRSIVGFLERLNYCQIDKGTYKNRDYCLNLSEDLIEEMINYILTNGPMVFYSSIYTKFQSVLNELGIFNYYYLKGLLDPFLPDEFITKRNYISTTPNLTSSYDTIVTYMKSFNGQFSLDDLRERFSGVKDYTFYNALYNEGDAGLIWLSSKKFIYIDKVVLTEETKHEFKVFIDNLFNSLGTDVISSRKIYARLALTNRNLLEKLKIAQDNFSTFSLIKYLFKGQYGFNRPIITLDVNSDVTSINVIVNYIQSLDTFNLKTIKNYVAKMNIRGINSYLVFMEDMSDEYVQYNIETMIKKDKFEISANELSQIDNLLKLMLERFNKIDTSTFSGYMMLPKLKYHWNKYLLVGIIRSYFPNDYEIENTSKFYDQTDFIIRRCAE